MIKTFSKWLKQFSEASNLSNTALFTSYLNPGWQKTKNLPWRKIFTFSWLAPGLETLVSIILKLGTLALVSFFLLFFLRLFKDQGYVLQSFSVPKLLEEQGYNGQVIALRIQDELTLIKEIAGSVKEDSLQLREDQGDIDLAVLGVGLSLRSLAFQLREIMGRENKTLRGEITKISDYYEVQVRMTGYPRIVKETQIGELTEKEALDTLIRQVAEGILHNTDPYRLALLYRKEERFDEAITTIRHLLRTNESEAHWAYLCWGAMLMDMDDDDGAIQKFERTIEVKPDFSLPYVNVAWLYFNSGRVDDGINAMSKACELEPENVWRHNSLAWMLHRDGQYERADSLYLKLMDHPSIDNPQTRMDVATSWAEMKMQRDDIQGVKEIIDEYISDYGENVISYIVQGVSAFTIQDTTSALNNFRQAFDLAPGDEGAVSACISLTSELGYCEETVDYYRRANFSELNEYNKMGCWNKVAMCFNTLGQYDSAYQLVQNAILIDPKISYPYTTLAETFLFQGKMDSCYFYFDRALALGYDIDDFEFNDPPYDLLKDDFTFQQIMKKYEKEADTDI